MDIGKVVHYYGKISVAVVELLRPLNLQDRVIFRGKNTEFEQVVDSMQIDYKNIERAEGGQEVAVKVHGRVRCGDRICLPEDDA